MWGSAHVWSEFQPRIEAAGDAVHAVTLRHHDVPPGAPPPQGLGTTGIQDYADDVEVLIRTLPEPPIIIGHSMGGLIAQVLAGRRLARAMVLLNAASPAGVFGIRPVMLPGVMRLFMVWGFWRKPQKLTRWEAGYCVLNGLPKEVADAQYSQFRWESGRAAFEIAYDFLDRQRGAAVNIDGISCPGLYLAGRHDRIVPASVGRAICRAYRGKLEYLELPDQTHWTLHGPGAAEVCERVLAWMNGR